MGYLSKTISTAVYHSPFKGGTYAKETLFLRGRL